MNVAWSFPTRVAAALLALLLVGVRPAAAQTPSAAVADTITLSLEEAQRLSLRQNPQFLADSREGAIARGQLRQARLPAFNPQANLELPGAATGGGSEYEASLTQEVEWAGQRGARVRAAGFGVQRADLTVRNAARITLGDVSNAYFDTYAARQRLQLAEEVLNLNEQLLRAVRIQLREGEVSALEANLAEVELGRARARVLAARRELTSAELQLKRLTGLSPDQPIRLPGAVPAAAPAPAAGRDSLVALALGRRPDLVAQRTAVLESRALTDLARREGRPNVSVGVLARREGDGGDPSVGLGVSVPFPVLNRNQGRLAEQQARTSQAELQARAVELAVRTEVTDALRAYQTATEEETVYAASVLQPTRENRALLETAYREGKIDLATLLLVRNQLLDAELDYWDTWRAQRRAQVFLEVATGASPVLADIDDTIGDTDND